MPIRVRCRCGQELVLRYGEWVYVFLGLALLSLLVNLLVLILLFLRVEDMRSGLRPAGSDPAATEPPGRAPPAAAPDRSRDESPAASKPGPPSSAGGEASPPSPIARASGVGASGGEAPRALRTFDSAPATIPEGPDEVAGSNGEPVPAAAGGPDPASVVAPPVFPWSGEPPLVRLLLLEKAGGPLPPEAFLADPDGLVRARAIRQVAVEPVASQPGRRALLEIARPFLQGDSGGRALFSRVRAGDAPPPGPEASDAALRDLVAPARDLLDDPRTVALRDYLRAAANGGMDLVILLDSSRSMGSRLESLRKDSAWLLEAVEWAIPGSRVGAVLYRDDLERVSGFSAGRAALVEVLRDAASEGGGDVPEGVHVALRAALSLGRFDWRPGSLKSLIVVGDAPPPWGERRPSILLVGQAFRQGGYRTHVVFAEDDDGFPESSPFFPELARAGGGWTRRISDPARIGSDVLLAAFPAETHKAVEPLVDLLRSSF